jgi:hypothetical protein
MKASASRHSPLTGLRSRWAVVKDRAGLASPKLGPKPFVGLQAMMRLPIDLPPLEAVLVRAACATALDSVLDSATANSRASLEDAAKKKGTFRADAPEQWFDRLHIPLSMILEQVANLLDTELPAVSPEVIRRLREESSSIRTLAEQGCKANAKIRQGFQEAYSALTESSKEVPDMSIGKARERELARAKDQLDKICSIIGTCSNRVADSSTRNLAAARNLSAILGRVTATFNQLVTRLGSADPIGHFLQAESEAITALANSVGELERPQMTIGYRLAGVRSVLSAQRDTIALHAMVVTRTRQIHEQNVSLFEK